MAGQFLAMLLMVGRGKLLPLGIIVFGVLAIPPMIVARLAAHVQSRLRAMNKASHQAAEAYRAPYFPAGLSRVPFSNSCASFSPRTAAR